MSARIDPPSAFTLDPLEDQDWDAAVLAAVNDPDFSHVETDRDLGWLSLCNRRQEFYAWIGRVDGKLAMVRNVGGGMRELKWL
jgi:hypothetical protein